jgi:hypothetical protein
MSNWPPDFTASARPVFPQEFPHLKPHHCKPDLSPATTDYNCIAWAASDTDNWWWPDDPLIGYGYWPNGVDRRETIEAFVAAYQTVGFERCDDGILEVGFEKIAIYALKGVPTHAARQLADGNWTSKLGPFEDIVHLTLECLKGPLYGEPDTYMRRPAKTV